MNIIFQTCLNKMIMLQINSNAPWYICNITYHLFCFISAKIHL